MNPGTELTPAETTLSLLFRKLHPVLEDAAHLLDRGAPAAEFERLHLRLRTARGKVVDLLEDLADSEPEGELGDLLDSLAADLTPVGESLQQSLVLTQLCLEEAPADLLRFVPPGVAATASWAKRMVGFLQRLEDPAFQARRRWEAIDPDLGEEGPE